MKVNRRQFILATASTATATLFPPAVRNARANDEPVIAAASNLQFALEQIADRFARNTGQKVRIAFGSSGNFARQIRQGAPYQAFLSADADYLLGLEREGLLKGEPVLYAFGRIVIVVPRGSPLRPDGTLEDLRAALQDGRVKKFAIANPEHAPYGKRAEEALRHRGLWDAIRPRLVFGENVSQAAQFATTASSQGGIIAYSLALTPKLAALSSYDLIPQEWHTPLRQSMALVKNAGPVAEQFFTYLRTADARSVLAQYGFKLPGE